MVSTFTLNFFISGTMEHSSWGDFTTPGTALLLFHSLLPFPSSCDTWPNRRNPPSEGLIMFNVTDQGGYKLDLLIPFIILGIIGGLLGSLFNKLNITITKWRKKVFFILHMHCIGVATVP